MTSVIDGFVDSNGVKIHTLAKSSASPKLSLLFVPGIMISAEIFKQQIDHFSKKYNVVVMEPRAHGLSEQVTEGLEAFTMAKDIQAVVEKLKIGPFVLTGWSLAVPQVINYAAHFGKDMLLGLVLIDGLAGMDAKVPFYDETIDHWCQFQKDRIPNTQNFIKGLFHSEQKQSYLEMLTEVALRTPTNSVMTLLYNYLLQDFRPLLTKINIPTLIATVKGPRLGYMEQMQKLLPNGSIKVFPKAGHALFVDEADQFNQMLDQFVQDLVRK